MNDNDDGRAVMPAVVQALMRKPGALVTEGRSVCVSTVSFGLPWRGFGLFGKLGRQNVSRLFGRAVCVAGVRLRCTY